MASAVDRDLVIIGGGCAGLSLASRLARRDSHSTVTVIEPRSRYVDDRSWCFWGPAEHSLSSLVSARWPAWRFSDSAGRSETHRVPGQLYQYIRSADFYADAVDRIERAPNVVLDMGLPVLDVISGEGRVTVQTPEGAITARHVVDTRPQRHGAALLYQCFVGQEVESPEPLHFDLDTVELMSLMEADSQGMGFLYALPLSATRALVEWTRFSATPALPQTLTTDLARALSSLGVAGSLTTLRTEQGQIGMGSPSAAASSSSQVVRAGVAGGAARAATGYAFLRIQRWADVCSVLVEAGAPPVPHPRGPWTQTTLDRLFLHVLRRHPERGADYFMALARTRPGPLLRFLTDAPRWTDLARIASSLPAAPFLHELVVPQMRHSVRAS